MKQEIRFIHDLNLPRTLLPPISETLGANQIEDDASNDGGLPKFPDQSWTIPIPKFCTPQTFNGSPFQISQGENITP